MAGMSAAHELIERGFEVVVLESGDIAGGKARSIPVGHEGEDTSGDQLAEAPGVRTGTACPASTGFGSSRASTSTSSTPCAAYRRLTGARWRITWCRRHATGIHAVRQTRVYRTGGLSALAPRCRHHVAGHPAGARPPTGLTPDDLAFFGARLWQILTSCKERRLGEYERTSWWDFVGAEQRSAAYQKFLATGITRSLVAAKARKASTRTIGDIFVQLVLTILNPIAGSTDRVLDGPTNLVWIDPWLEHLELSGVQYVKNAEVEEILCEAGRITGVVARQQGKRTVVRGDHYVAALPLEDMAPMVNGRLAAADPTLANLRALALNVEWMNGVQFYLHRAVPSAHGHVVHIDTEWALTSISQLQFWRNVPASCSETATCTASSRSISPTGRRRVERTPRHAVLA